jgi:hypothetical protein
MRAHRLTALASVLIAVGAAAGTAGGRTAPGGCGEEPPETAMYFASVGGSSGHPRRGLVVRACTPESSLARITVRFSRGAEIRLRRRDSAYDFARYFIGPELGGTLRVPAGKASGRFRLRFEANRQTEPAPVRAMLRTGRKPSLVISGLPAEAKEFTLSTVGAGDRGTRATRCRRGMVSYSGTMRIRLSSGARDHGDASGGFSCSALPPARCAC